MTTEARTREQELVLACACREPAQARRQEISSLCSGPLDWEAVEGFARRHALLPLVFRHLSSIAPSRIPRDRYAVWWATSEALSRRNSLMAARLEGIVSTLRAGGIAAIPYKGPTLALSAYGDLALREFDDLDLLVAPANVARAVDLLVGAGFRSALSLSPDAQRRLVLRSRHYEWPLVDDASDLLLELHWRADPEYPVVEPGAPLSATLLELVLLLHGTKHFWSRAAWLADVAALAEATPIDWEWISSASRRMGCVRQASLGLRLAADLVGMAPPPGFANELRDPVVTKMAAQVTSEILGPVPRPSMAREFRRNIALRATPRAKAVYAWRSCVTPGLKDWQRWRLPAPLAVLYWPLRPVRLAEKYLLRRTPPAARPRTPPPRPHSTG